MNRRTFASLLALAPLAARAGSDELDAERFAALHADFARRFRYVDAHDECGSNYCGHTLAQAQATMRGNCLDYGMVLLAEGRQRAIGGLEAVWCRMVGLPHLVVVHRPSTLVADTALHDARPWSRRPDLTDARVIWPTASSRLAVWDGREGRIW